MGDESSFANVQYQQGDEHQFHQQHQDLASEPVQSSQLVADSLAETMPSVDSSLNSAGSAAAVASASASASAAEASIEQQQLGDEWVECDDEPFVLWWRILIAMIAITLIGAFFFYMEKRRRKTSSSNDDSGRQSRQKSELLNGDLADDVDHPDRDQRRIWDDPTAMVGLDIRRGRSIDRPWQMSDDQAEITDWPTVTLTTPGGTNHFDWTISGGHSTVTARTELNVKSEDSNSPEVVTSTANITLKGADHCDTNRDYGVESESAERSADFDQEPIRLESVTKEMLIGDEVNVTLADSSDQHHQHYDQIDTQNGVHRAAVQIGLLKTAVVSSSSSSDNDDDAVEAEFRSGSDHDSVHVSAVGPDYDHVRANVPFHLLDRQNPESDVDFRRVHDDHQDLNVGVRPVDTDDQHAHFDHPELNVDLHHQEHDGHQHTHIDHHHHRIDSNQPEINADLYSVDTDHQHTHSNHPELNVKLHQELGDHHHDHHRVDTDQQYTDDARDPEINVGVQSFDADRQQLHSDHSESNIDRLHKHIDHQHVDTDRQHEHSDYPETNIDLQPEHNDGQHVHSDSHHTDSNHQELNVGLRPVDVDRHHVQTDHSEVNVSLNQEHSDHWHTDAQQPEVNLGHHQVDWSHQQAGPDQQEINVGLDQKETSHEHVDIDQRPEKSHHQTTDAKRISDNAQQGPADVGLSMFNPLTMTLEYGYSSENANEVRLDAGHSSVPSHGATLDIGHKPVETSPTMSGVDQSFVHECDAGPAGDIAPTALDSGHLHTGPDNVDANENGQQTLDVGHIGMPDDLGRPETTLTTTTETRELFGNEKQFGTTKLIFDPATGGEMNVTVGDRYSDKTYASADIGIGAPESTSNPNNYIGSLKLDKDLDDNYTGSIPSLGLNEQFDLAPKSDKSAEFPAAFDGSTSATNIDHDSSIEIGHSHPIDVNPPESRLNTNIQTLNLRSDNLIDTAISGVGFDPESPSRSFEQHRESTNVQLRTEPEVVPGLRIEQEIRPEVELGIDLNRRQQSFPDVEQELQLGQAPEVQPEMEPEVDQERFQARSPMVYEPLSHSRSPSYEPPSLPEHTTAPEIETCEASDIEVDDLILQPDSNFGSDLGAELHIDVQSDQAAEVKQTSPTGGQQQTDQVKAGSPPIIVAAVNAAQTSKTHRSDIRLQREDTEAEKKWRQQQQQDQQQQQQLQKVVNGENGASAKPDEEDDGRRSSIFEVVGARNVEEVLMKLETLEAVAEVMRLAGLETSNLIFGIDYTASNKYQGEVSFEGESLHKIDSNRLNPYQQVIKIMGQTLAPFAKNGYIPAYGFGDIRTSDWSLFALKQGAHCESFDEVLKVYTEITPKIILSGPTNFAPLIYQAIDICREFKSYHILVIAADGQVTNERATRRAIVEACKYPLSIIVVGVGDGPWNMMRVFDDNLPKRPWDNFHFVEFYKVTAKAQNPDLSFAVQSLLEIPDQYKQIKALGLLEFQDQ